MTPREQLIQEVLLIPESRVELLLKILRPLRSGAPQLTEKLEQLVEPADLPAENPNPSVFDLAGPLIGCLDSAPPDLSTNPDYFEGFGQ